MSLQPITDRYSVEEIRHLHDLALADAQRLRREAIDDFWRGANGLLGEAALSARRAGVRLAQRLQRRRRDAGGTAWPAGMA